MAEPMIEAGQAHLVEDFVRLVNHDLTQSRGA